MTSNGIVALTLRYSPNPIALEADCVNVLQDRPKMSAEYRLPLLAKTYSPCSAARSLCAIAELLVYFWFYRKCACVSLL